MAKGNKPPPDWSFGFTLSSDHVWLAFYLYCLLEDVSEWHEYLVVKHTGDQKDRFTELVQGATSACASRVNPRSHISVMNVHGGSMVLTVEVSTLLPRTELAL